MEITSEQLEKLAIYNTSGFWTQELHKDQLAQLIILARQGLQLREEIQTRHSETHYENRMREIGKMKVGMATAVEVEDELRKQITTLTTELEAVTRGYKVATLKASSSLANNLCPDHRDKQGGKPCLACEIEALRKDRQRLDNWKVWLAEVYEIEGKFFLGREMEVVETHDGFDSREGQEYPDLRTAIDSAIEKEKSV